MTQEREQGLAGRWALILGASSGFGAAAARALAQAGMNIFGVHLDPRRTLHRAQQVIADVEAAGGRAVFFNTNAADARRRARVIASISEVLADDPFGSIHLMVHTLAFGSLRQYVPENPEEAVTERWLKKRGIAYDEIQIKENKEEVDLDILIDDRVETVEKFIAAGRKAFLFTQPWNAESDLPRVDGWAQIVRVCREESMAQRSGGGWWRRRE